MKKLIIVSIVAVATLSCATLSGKKSKSLFNGKDLTGWHVDIPKMDNDPNLTSSFIVRDGLLVSLGTPRGHLITDEVHQNYRLDVQHELLLTGNVQSKTHTDLIYEAFFNPASGSEYRHYY